MRPHGHHGNRIKLTRGGQRQLLFELGLLHILRISGPAPHRATTATTTLHPTKTLRQERQGTRATQREPGRRNSRDKEPPGSPHPAKKPPSTPHSNKATAYVWTPRRNRLRAIRLVTLGQQEQEADGGSKQHPRPPANSKTPSARWNTTQGQTRKA